MPLSLFGPFGFWRLQKEHNAREETLIRRTPCIHEIAAIFIQFCSANHTTDFTASTESILLARGVATQNVLLLIFLFQSFDGLVV